MSNIVFGGGEPMHRHLAKFTARSAQTVQYDGSEYVIHHTQFASYDLQDAFETAVRGTDLDPRTSLDFSREIDDVIEESVACITDRDLQHHYSNREYVDASDLHRAASDYYMYHVTMEEDGRLPMDYARPRASSREAAIADVFTLMHAQNAGMDAFLSFGATGPPYFGDDDDDSKPDEGFNHSEIAFALRDTAATLHGPTALRQPDPSLHVTRALFQIYDAVGMQPTVRDVYGVIVSPMRPRYYELDDADDRRMGRMMGDMMGAAMRGGATPDRDRKWTSVDEPPLETLESYEDHTDQEPGPADS